ncbi:MAG: PrgI family protein [Candidatus Magasanikbacteria bacterium]
MQSQFTVPQFIDVEDKILGPLTVRQFVIILISGLIIFLAFRFGDFALFVLTLIFVGGLGLLFAFVKIGGQTFHYFLLNIFQWGKNPKKRIWRKGYTEEELNYLRNKDMVMEKVEIVKAKPVRREHIRDLSLIVNTGGFYNPEDSQNYEK